MMMKLGNIGVISLKDYIEPKDTIKIQLGNDFSYSDVEEKVVIANKTIFNGSNHIDTGIKLLSEDRDFVLAIDYEIDRGTANNSVLAQCFSGLDSSGFKLSYNGGSRITWGSNFVSPSDADNYRQMLIIRHIKGENGAYIYTSNVQDDSSYYMKLDGAHSMVHNVSLTFGCSKLEDGSYENHASGIVYWSKIWYADLGDNVCTQMACWPHEEMTFEACCESDGNLKRYYLSDNSGTRSSITFVASTALSQPVKMNSTSSLNEGGWAQYSLNTYLNNRVYKAFPIKWKQLMKQVKVKSSVGNMSSAISNSDCYIFIPSASEVYANMTTEPYASEGTLISHFSNNETRICYISNGTAVPYWTRSPNIGYNNYVYRVKEDGSLQGVTTMSQSNVYARIMITM
jgi:hypothetical protein